MALCWNIQGPCNSSFFVLWVLVITVCGVKRSSSSDYTTGSETISSSLTVNNVEHYLTQRSTDDQKLQPLVPEINKDTDNFNNYSKSILQPEVNKYGDAFGLKEKAISYEVNEDEVKSKNNKEQKINFNPKTYTNSKIASNISNNEKQKSYLFGVQGGSKYNNLKKELNLNTFNSEQMIKSNLSNLAVSSSYKHESRETLQLTEFGTTNFTKTAKPGDIKMNETNVMSDQPAPIDTLNNSTDLSNDDSLDIFDTNTTSKTFDDSNSTTSANGRTMPTTGSWDVLVVSGIILGTLVFIGVVAGGGYVIYRRRIWNKPQTLSDKCSNADSSGYIDDSTIRENSEEMYSLDNDSFLNSLEAMTIQNYWTDNVKHTKL